MATINAYAYQHFGATPRVRIIGRVRCTEPGYAYWAAKCVITSPTAFWWKRGEVIWQRPGTLYLHRSASRVTGAYTYKGGVSMDGVPELEEAAFVDASRDARQERTLSGITGREQSTH